MHRQRPVPFVMQLAVRTGRRLRGSGSLHVDRRQSATPVKTEIVLMFLAKLGMKRGSGLRRSGPHYILNYSNNIRVIR